MLIMMLLIPTPKTILNKNNVTLKDKLCKLISDYHISHNCVNELLQILRSEGLDLPKDVRTLLKTPKTHEIINVYPGSYIHIGVEYMVSPILVAYFDKLKCTNLIQLSINIDGLPITKNSKSTLWPILIPFVNIVDLKHMYRLMVPRGQNSSFRFALDGGQSGKTDV